MKEESWIKQYWRPAVAWQYLVVCIFDFILFPSFALKSGMTWDPLTLRESGFYHLAMAAIIGVAAWTRGQEKITKLLEGESITEKSSTTQTPAKGK